jgi:REP element-mobilizing transposase RayT
VSGARGLYGQWVSRPLRVNAPGAVFHLIARGNARESVFLDDLDRRAFLEFLRRVADRFEWIVYAYCLMGNHYHLVVETPKGNLSRGMAHGYTLREIAEHLGCHYSTVSRKLSRAERTTDARTQDLAPEFL